jgi:hypothetical protein
MVIVLEMQKTLMCEWRFLCVVLFGSFFFNERTVLQYHTAPKVWRKSSVHRRVPRRAVHRRIDVPALLQRVTSRAWTRRCATQRRSSPASDDNFSNNAANSQIATTMPTTHPNRKPRRRLGRLNHLPTMAKQPRRTPANAVVHAVQRSDGIKERTAALSRKIYHHQSQPLTTKRLPEHTRSSLERP